jgi:putative membrane-bound dehydrogenase-like protein
MTRIFTAVLTLGLVGTTVAVADETKTIKLLFLGDNGHHRPEDRFRQLQPVLARRGIDMTYTDRVDALDPKTLDRYDGLVIYANTTKISPEQEKALLDFVEGGKGFIPLHCASYCFLNSPRYIDLVGAQFLRHGTGTFHTTIAQPDHPIMKGFKGFESWDETYVHTKHNDKDRTMLEYREENGTKEPWTWVRSQGKGRVFYTAWGHDSRTWGNPGFQNLVERGIRWAVGGDPSVVPAYTAKPRMTPKRTDVKPFEYTAARVPFYPSGRQWGITGKPFQEMQKPLEPAESMKHFITPEDFEVQLFASEPDLGGKPISMSWDERGRLWVCVTVDYPNEKQAVGEGRDRIVICEDTKGTGRADKFTVFADKLSLPTSLTFYRGGVIVHQPPETLYLKDLNGDDVADERRVLFTGWSTADTHAGPSNLHYSLDNWIYGIVGYSGFDGMVGGEHLRFSQGFYRFRPDGSRMEFLRNTNNNSWGVGFSEEGVLFGSTANGNPSVYLPIPNRYYEAVRGWSSTVLPAIGGNPAFEAITDKIRQVDYHGHFTAGAGHDLYTARSYPPEYWNRTAFVAEPTAHLLTTFTIQPQGAGYRSRLAWNLLASDDEWSAPVFGAVGPDGQVWVIDWYNYIVQHNPTPAGWKTGKGGAYETELRDKNHGRIYRVVYKGAKPTERFSLHDASEDKLVSTLQNDNMFWRLHAQRLLVERVQQDVLPALVTLASSRKLDAIGLNPGAIHALWTMHGLGALDGSHPEATAVAVAALRHPSAGVRRNAVQVLPRNAASVDALVKSGCLRDDDDQVRLTSLLTLADMQVNLHAAAAVLVSLRDPRTLGDRWLADAATCAAAAHAEPFLIAALAPTAKETSSSGFLSVLERVAEHEARGGPKEIAGKLLETLAAASADRAGAVVAGLSRGWPRDRSPVLDRNAEAALVQLFRRLSSRAQGQVVELATRWHCRTLEKQAGEIAAVFLARVQDSKAGDRDRAAAALQLVDLLPTDKAIVAKLFEMINPRTPPQLAQGILDALSHSETKEAGTGLVEMLPTLTPEVRADALGILLGNSDWTLLFLDAVAAGKLPLTDLSLDQRQSLLAHPRRRIAMRARNLLARNAGIPNPDRQKVIDEFMPITNEQGDPAAGKIVFQKNCAVCHTHSGEGGKVGPDLTGMAVHPKSHLLTDILDPSRNVEGNYRQYVLSTRAGKTFSGLLASESKTAVELLDAQGKRHSILREDIDELQASNKSLMPEGFEKQIPRNDLTNLLEFLAHKDRFLPLPLGQVATTVSTRGMFYGPEVRAERLVFDDWAPKTFHDVPFMLVDPHGDKIPNMVLLYGPEGLFPPKMPRSVSLPCNTAAKAIHLLSGVSGWGFPLGQKGSVSLIVRVVYEDGTTEEHPLKNGIHFADYIRRVDVPESQFAFSLHGRQLRYLSIEPQKHGKIKQIDFVKGPDDTAPVIAAVTIECASP